MTLTQEVDFLNALYDKFAREELVLHNTGKVKFEFSVHTEGVMLPTFIKASPQPSTLNPRPSTLNPQPSTLNPQPSTPNPLPSTLNPKLQSLDPEP